MRSTTYNHKFRLTFDFVVPDSEYEDGSDCIQHELAWVIDQLQDKLDLYLKGCPIGAKPMLSLEDILDLRDTTENRSEYDGWRERTRDDLVTAI